MNVVILSVAEGAFVSKGDLPDALAYLSEAATRKGGVFAALLPHPTSCITQEYPLLVLGALTNFLTHLIPASSR